MAAEDFSPASPEEDDDLFEFAELSVEDDSIEPEVSTSSTDEEIMEAVERAAAQVQDELGPQPDASAGDLDEDELTASFPEGMLDMDDDDLFSFDSLLSEENEPTMDASIVDEEDRYGMTAKEAAEVLDLDETEEQEQPQEQSVEEAGPSAVDSNAAAPEEFDPFDVAEGANHEQEAALPEDDFLAEDSAEEEVDLYAEVEIDRQAEQEEFASLLADPEPEVEEGAEASDTLNDVIQPLPPAAAESNDGAPTKTSRLLDRFALQTDAGKPLAVVLGSFLLLNVVLAFLAIFAFFKVGSGLQGMKSSLAGSLETIAREAERAQQQSTPVEPADEDLAEEASPETPTQPNSVNMVLEPRERTELRAARAEIEAGKFEVARRRLFRLLAVADSPLSEEGRIAEEEANLLVARSFEEEAHALIAHQARVAEEEARGQRQ